MARVLAVLLVLLLAPTAALGDMSPGPARNRTPPGPSADQEYARGVAATQAKEWSVAGAAFGKAVEMKPDYAEAWNGLGFALRNQGRYPEALKAYGRALELRPDYPEALEYLGEAYVKMGRLDDARGVLRRLQPLDRERAGELSEAIARGR